LLGSQSRANIRWLNLRGNRIEIRAQNGKREAPAQTALLEYFTSPLKSLLARPAQLTCTRSTNELGLKKDQWTSAKGKETAATSDIAQVQPSEALIRAGIEAQV